MAETKQNEIEGLVAYLEQVPRYKSNAECFLVYSIQFNFTSKCYWPCFS